MFMFSYFSTVVKRLARAGMSYSHENRKNPGKRCNFERQRLRNDRKCLADLVFGHCLAQEGLLELMSPISDLQSIRILH